MAATRFGDQCRVLVDYAGLAAVLAGLVAFFGVTTENFFTAVTFRTIANQIPDAVIIAVGMTFVLIVGGIDLSVGSVLALCGSVLGVSLARLDWPLWAGIVACVSVGLACGLVSGIVTVRWAIPSFIVTLGMLEIARGGSYLVTHSQTQYIGSPVEVISEIALFGLSCPFLVAVGVVVAGQVALSHTIVGRHILAVGANEESARLSGVNTGRIRVAVFGLSGLLAGLAAVIHTSRLGSADPNAGTGYELQAIAAVVIGGTSLMGGRGSVVSSFFGVLIITVLGYGLDQVGAQEPTKRIVTGCVIVVAVVTDYYRRRLGSRGGVGKGN